MSNPRKPRILMPNNENIYSPDVVNKYGKPYTEQSEPEIIQYVSKKNKENLANNLSIPQINAELDKNLDQIIYMLNRRKQLMLSKKKKILQQAAQKMSKAKINVDLTHPDIINDEEFLKIISFTQNPKTSVRVLTKIIQTIPQIKGPRIDQEERSQQFWSRNRKLQNDIDSLLQKLKYIDKQLQKQNGQVLETCRELDKIQQTLKSFVGAKSPDHMQKVQPLFNSKKKNYDLLNRKIKDRQISKDKKIQFIKRIRNILQQLKRIRSERLQQIAQFFGVEDSWQFDQINFKDQGDFSGSLQQLLKLKERDNQLQLAQRQVISQMQLLEQQQQRVHGQLLKILSDEAQSFHRFNSILVQRLKYNSILSLFQGDEHLSDIEPKQYLKKYKQVKTFFKKFLQEDSLLKQGLMKTTDTAKTFLGLLKATQNQKQRRHQLLGLLEACIKKRGQYEQKRQQMRSLQFEQSRNQQEHTQYLQDLEEMLTDGDIDHYKKIGNAINKCQVQKNKLQQAKEMIQKQMDSMDRDVLSIANRIQEQYNDILSDILPSDYEYSLRSGEDVKKLRNQLRKMYKRLGLLNSE